MKATERYQDTISIFKGWKSEWWDIFHWWTKPLALIPLVGYLLCAIICAFAETVVKLPSRDPGHYTDL